MPNKSKLPPVKSTDRVAISGIPDSGKTVFAQFMALRAMPNVFVYDPLDQFTMIPADKRYVPETDSMAEFEAICAKMCSVTNTMFIVEEGEKYIRQGGKLEKHAFDVINRGRNWGIGMVVVTRRIQALSKDFFDLAAHSYLFRCAPGSRRYLEEKIGKQRAGQVIGLPPRYYLHHYVSSDEIEIGTLKLSGGEARDLDLER